MVGRQCICRTGTKGDEMLIIDMSACLKVAPETDRASLQDDRFLFIILHLLSAVAERVLELARAVDHLAPVLGIHGESMVWTGAAQVVRKVFLDYPSAECDGSEDR